MLIRNSRNNTYPQDGWFENSLYCFGSDNEGTDAGDAGGVDVGGKAQDPSEFGMGDSSDRGVDSRGNTVNFNVDRSKPSVQTSTGKVYGTQAQLDAKFGPTPPDTSIPGVSFSPGGGLPTFAQQVGYAGAYSPTTVQSRAYSYGTGIGTSAPDYGTATGQGGLGIADMVAASQRGYANFTVGSGFARAPVYDLVDNKQVLATPGVVGVGKQGGFRTDAEMARDMALMTQQSYAGRITDVPDRQFGDFLGVDTEKGAYAVTAGRTPGSTMEVSRVVGEEVLAEQAVGMMGLPGTIMLGTSPDFARIQSLETGEEGTYTEVGGLAGLLGGSGGKASFGESEAVFSGGDSDPVVAASQTYAPISTRFRSIQQFDPIRSLRFPRAPSPDYGRVPTRYAATGGYIGDPESFLENVKSRKRGYHAFNVGGKVYGVSPDERNPGQYNVFGGTLDEVRNAMGTAYGYEPSSINFGMFPGEEGFGQDTIQPMQNMRTGGIAGFVGARPEQVEEKETIADNVNMDVPKGTFVINAPAVEYAGSSDVEKMLDDATAKANAIGVDIEKEVAKISSKDLVPLAVSPGEVLVDPVRAKIIGYGLLEKINNRGLEEVARRQEGESTEEKPESPQQGFMMAEGGNTAEYDMYAKNVLDVVEGATQEPHVPTANSGVTIGRGVDLSQFLPEQLARMGVNDEIIEKARPFLATGVGKFGPKGTQAKQRMPELQMTPEEAQALSDTVYQYKKTNFEKDFPQFKDAVPKDKAMAFSAYYVAGKRGMEDRYLTFLDTYEKTGDIVKSMDEGFLKILNPGDTEYNRTLNALNWYFTADDADLAMKSAGEQEKYTKGMIEAFRRKEELDSAPAGFIPPKSRGRI